MLCDFEWPYEGRDTPRDINWELEQARKELDIMTARCCRLAGYMEQILGVIPEEDREWYSKHKEYDNKKKAKNARKTSVDHPRC